MDFFLADVKSEAVNEYVKKVQDQRLFWPEICSKGQICTTVWLMKHQK